VGNRYKQNYKLTGEQDTMNTLIRTSIERPADLRQLIRNHQFLIKTTPINKHQKDMKQSMNIKTIPCLQRRSPACIASIAGRTLSLLVLFALGSFVVSPPPNAFGVSPAPDGGYPGGNTAEGQAALSSLTSGAYNTAIGLFSVRSNTEGSFNTAVGAGTLLLSTGEENTATGAGALLSNTTGIQNTANGAFSLFSNTEGSDNTAVGDQTLFGNTIGFANTATGYQALFGNTTGNFNTATGDGALASNTSGGENTATGGSALFSNTTGEKNTATGDSALVSNTTGGNNTAIGSEALVENTTGSFNTASGVNALGNNSTGNENTATGVGALANNTEAEENTAAGFNALYINTTGASNTAMGMNALFNNTTGSANTATGEEALYSNTNGFWNTAIGAVSLDSNTTGYENTAIGDDALSQNTTGYHNMALGQGAGSQVTTANHVIAIGHPGSNLDNSCYIGQIYGQAVDPATAAFAYIDANAKMGTLLSSRRFKRDITPMDTTSEAILALKPVTFHYKSDAKSTPCFGLIAEEVAEANPDLIVRDKEGKPYSVRYDAVNAMLLNEFLKEHKKVEAQQVTITELKSTVAQQQKGMEILTAQFKDQAAQIQKVSAQLQISKSARRAAGRIRRGGSASQIVFNP